MNNNLMFKNYDLNESSSCNEWKYETDAHQTIKTKQRGMAYSNRFSIIRITKYVEKEEGQ